MTYTSFKNLTWQSRPRPESSTDRLFSEETCRHCAHPTDGCAAPIDMATQILGKPDELRYYATAPDAVSPCSTWLPVP